MRDGTVASMGALRAPALALTAFALLLVLPALARAQAPGKFSFAVYGDSRTMMYLPYTEAEKDEAIKLMTQMFQLVMPEKMAEAVVKRDVKVTYDPQTHELVQIVMPF